MFGNYRPFPILLHEDIDTGVLAVDTAIDPYRSGNGLISTMFYLSTDSKSPKALCLSLPILLFSTNIVRNFWHRSNSSARWFTYPYSPLITRARVDPTSSASFENYSWE